MKHIAFTHLALAAVLFLGSSGIVTPAFASKAPAVACGLFTQTVYRFFDSDLTNVHGYPIPCNVKPETSDLECTMASLVGPNTFKIDQEIVDACKASAAGLMITEKCPAPVLTDLGIDPDDRRQTWRISVIKKPSPQRYQQLPTPTLHVTFKENPVSRKDPVSRKNTVSKENPVSRENSVVESKSRKVGTLDRVVSVGHHVLKRRPSQVNVKDQTNERKPSFLRRTESSQVRSKPVQSSSMPENPLSRSSGTSLRRFRSSSASKPPNLANSASSKRNTLDMLTESQDPSDQI